MGGNLKRIEPNNCTSIMGDEIIQSLIRIGGLELYMRKCIGHDKSISQKVAESSKESRVIVGRIKFEFSIDFVAIAINLSL